MDERTLRVAEELLRQYEERTQAKRTLQQREMSEPFVPWEKVRERLKCKDEIWRRIRKMNPDHRGIKQGQRLRGYYPSQPFSKRLHIDVMTPRSFIARYGSKEYRSLPREAFIRAGHRKAIPAMWVMENIHG